MDADEDFMAVNPEDGVEVFARDPETGILRRRVIRHPAGHQPDADDVAFHIEEPEVIPYDWD